MDQGATAPGEGHGAVELIHHATFDGFENSEAFLELGIRAQD
jgi:hypothetical protein